MFIRDILSQKRYLPVKLAIVAVIASFIAVLSFHISRSSGVSTFNSTVTNDTDVGSQKKMSYGFRFLLLTLQPHWSSKMTRFGV